MSSIVTLCLSAGIQKTISFDSLKTGAVNRSRSYIYDAAGKAVNSARVLTQLMEADDADRRREDSRAFENAADNKAVSAFRAPEDSRASQAAAADKASGAYKACAPESACQAAPDNKASSAFKAPAAPDDVTLICPLGKKNADFFLQLAARDGLNPETVLIPGYTRECCTLLDDATGEVTELVVEEPAPEGDAPVSDLLFTLRTALTRASAFGGRKDSSAVAFQNSLADKAAGVFKASDTSVFANSADNKTPDACKTAGAQFADKALSDNKAAGAAAFASSYDNKASATFKAAGGSASVSEVDNKASVSCMAAGALPRTALLFAGSRPAFWPKDIIIQIALAAKKAGALFMADFRGDDLLSLLDTSAFCEHAGDKRAAVAYQAVSDNKASVAFKAARAGSASESGCGNKTSDAFKTTGESASECVTNNKAPNSFKTAGTESASVSEVDNKVSVSYKAVGTLPRLVPDIIKINEAEFRETFMREQPADSTMDFGKIPSTFSPHISKTADCAGCFGKANPVAATSSVNAHSAAATSADKAAGYAACTDGAGSLAAAICKKSRELQNIIVVTRGEASTLAADCGTLYECASEKVNAVNTIGCGDSFNAGFLYEYMTSGNVELALKKGTWCAARNAERLSPGTIL